MRKWGRLWTKRALAIALALVLVLSQEAPVIAAEANDLQDGGYETAVETVEETVTDSEEGITEDGLTEDGALTDENQGEKDGTAEDGTLGEIEVEGVQTETVDDDGAQLTDEPEEESAGDEDLEDLFPGVTLEGFLEDAEIQQDKDDVRATLDAFYQCVPGEDYTENEIFVEADDEEQAQLYAEAYGGTLVDYVFGFAFIRLNADADAPERTAEEAILASVEEDVALPAAWPNLIGTVASEDLEMSQDYVEATDEAYWEESVEMPSDEEGVVANAYNDPLLRMNPANGAYQYQHAQMQTEVAWDAGYTGSGVKVAILDTGVNLNHEDLGNTAASRSAYYNYSTNKIVTGTVHDTQTHGTHCTGLVGATANNGKGGAGIAPNATLYNCGMFYESGESFDTIAFLRAMDWAISQKVDVISLSVSIGYSYAEHRVKTLETPVDAATAKGIAVIAAAGNFGGNNTAFPAQCENAISVGAVNQNGAATDFSNQSKKNRYSAPGFDVYSTIADGGYDMMSGTSMATPCISGAYAVVLSYAKANGLDPGFGSPKRVKTILTMMDRGCTRTGIGKGTPNLARILGLRTKAQVPNVPTLQSGMAPGTYNRDSLSITIRSDAGTSLWYNTDGKKISLKNGIVSNAVKASSVPLTLTIGGGTTSIRVMAVRNENMLCSPVAVFNYKLNSSVTGVEMHAPSEVFKVQKGASLPLTAIVKPSSVANKNVVWSIVESPVPVGIAISTKGVLATKTTATVSSVTVRATSALDSSKYIQKSISIVNNTMPVASMKPSVKAATVYTGLSTRVDITTLLKDKSQVLTADYAACSSSDSTIATASLSGNRLTITGKNPGKCTIVLTANDGSRATLNYAVTVLQKVNSISISKPSGRVAQGKSVTLTPVFNPVKPANKSVKWELTNTPRGAGVGKDKECGVAFDVKRGVFKASAAAATGNYSFKVTSLDPGAASATCTITVVASTQAITGLTVSASRDRIFRVTNGYGAPTSCTIYATASTSDTAAKDCLAVTSSNPGIATVTKSSTGVYTVRATGMAIGATNITVITTDGTNIKKTIKITVANPATGLTLGLPAGRSEILAYGRSIQLIPTFYTESGAIDKAAKSLKWTVSNPSIASINTKGVLTSRVAKSGKGAVLVTAEATDGSGVSATYVMALNPKMHSLWLSATAVSGGAFDIKVTPYSYGSTLYETYTYKVLGSGSSSVNRYKDSNGKTHFVVRGLRAGDYKFVVTLNDGSGTNNYVNLHLYD